MANQLEPPKRWANEMTDIAGPELRIQLPLAYRRILHYTGVPLTIAGWKLLMNKALRNPGVKAQLAITKAEARYRSVHPGRKPLPRGRNAV